MGQKQSKGSNEVKTAQDLRDDLLTQTDKEIILKIHNELRSQCALGNYANKNGSMLVLPTAAKMIELEWSQALEASALAVARRRQMKHSADMEGDAGENIGYFTTTEPYSQEMISRHVEQIVHKLGSEIAEHGVTDLRLPDDMNSFEKIGHTSQILSDRTTHLGAACVEMEPNAYLCVFHYSPAGNIRGQSFYVKGAIGSLCPSEAAFNPMTGLCKLLHNSPN